MDRRRFICGTGYGLLSLGLAGCSFKIPGQSGDTQSSKTASQAERTPAASGYDRGKIVVAGGTDPNAD